MRPAIDRATLTRHIAFDVDRVAPLLARILVIRAIRSLRYGYGEHALWVAQDMASDCRDELGTAGAATRDLARALVPDHDADRDLALAADAAARLSAAIRIEGNSYSNYHQATDPDIYIDKQRAGELWDEWQEQKSHVNEAMRDLPQDLGSGETGSLLLDRALDRVFERGLYYEIRHHLFSREPERAWRRRVAGVLNDAARAGLSRAGTAPIGEELADRLQAGRRALDGTEPSAWARNAASRLDEIAIPLFTGREPYTAVRGTAIRLLALCLACESEAARIPVADDPYRRVVIGITLMEQDAPEDDAEDDP
ncbi:hypothetical protein [Actinomadura sp. SCN-SB]|uniref:hypothetical protein n=1 Tax=Actinomadura sp. SCN-SB TaxID=3373092 RepID=UPI003751B334